MARYNKKIEKQFHKKSELKAFDQTHRDIIKFNISRYDKAVALGKQQYTNLDLAKKRAACIKINVLNDLENQILIFESNFKKRGGKVIWARDKDEAVNQILSIVKKADAKTVVKSKSMITEELELNDALENIGVESLETDLGEYIVQIDNDKPYHIVTPIMHKSKENVAKIFNEKFGTPPNSKPEELTVFVREKLRKKFVQADVGITGANFIVADPGGVALTENEGNIAMTMSWPKIHIAVVGIEKIIPKMEDFDIFWPLLATHGTGQHMTAYNSIVMGPRQENEVDGPEQMYVVLVDNGRTNLLAHKPQRRALTCIRCGSCLNVCPVYRTIGGHTYDSVYPGPIGSVITPFLKSIGDYKHLSFASTLCGKCSENCPVEIPLHKLLLENRNLSVEKGYDNIFNAGMMKGFKMIVKKRQRMDFFGPGFKNLGVGIVAKGMWGPRRDFPKFQSSYNKYMKDKNK